MTLQFGTTFEIRWCHFCSFLVVQDHRYFNTFLLISTSGHISLFPLLFQPAGVYLHRCVYCLGVWVVCCIDVWVCLCKCVCVGMFFISVFLQRLQSRCACSVPILWWHLSSSKTGMVRWEWVGVMYPGTLELKNTCTCVVLIRMSVPLMIYIVFFIRCRSQKSGSTHGFILSPFQSLYVVVLLLVQVYCIFLHGVQGFLKHYEFLPLLMTSVSCAVGVVWSWLICYHDFLTDEGAKQRIE